VRHPLRWALLALLVVVLAAGGAIAWYVFGDDAPPKPTLSDATVARGTASDPEGDWTVVPGEERYVGYRIKELFGGATIKKDAVGRTEAISGSMTIADGSVRSARVTAELGRLESNRVARDTYLASNALETDEFPDAAFALTRPVALPEPLEVGQEIELEAVGELTLHGVTKTVTVDLEARFDGDRVEVAGSAPVVLADYGIDRPDTPVAAVDEKGSLELHLVFERV
jgi:polyisoprenoid-binding protein YceI